MTQVRVQQHVRRRAQLPKTAKPKIPAFHTVTADMPFGELLAKREREQTLCEGEGKIFGFDELLGDDEYVFLSVGAPMREVSYEIVGKEGRRVSATCFLFDAEELVRRGALVRLGDIMMTDTFADFDRAVQSAQQSLLTEYFILKEKVGSLNEKLATKLGLSNDYHRFEELESALGNEFEVEGLNVSEMSKEQLKVLLRSSYSVNLAFQNLKKRRDQITLRGDAALKALRECNPEQRCEILVPKRLSLLLARKAGRKEEF